MTLQRLKEGFDQPPGSRLELMAGVRAERQAEAGRCDLAWMPEKICCGQATSLCALEPPPPLLRGTSVPGPHPHGVTHPHGSSAKQVFVPP